MTEATILHEAEMELWEAVWYYENKAKGLGLDFEAEVEQCVQTIRESPKRCSLRDDGTRRHLTHRFPFLVVYTFQDDHVWIIAFAHSKRRPGYWTDRLRRSGQT